MRLAEIFRAAWSGGVLGFATFTLLARFLRARGARTALIPLLAIATTAALIALIALWFARTVGGAVVELPQCAAEIFKFAFVGELLAFGNFDEFQHFFHLIYGALEDIYNGHHLINRLMDGGHAMLWFDAGDALGQALNTFDERARRNGRATRRKRFGCGALGTRGALILALFLTGLLWRGLLVGRSGSGSGLCCGRSGRVLCDFGGRGFGSCRGARFRGGILRVGILRVFTGAGRERLAASATSTATATAIAGACGGLVACGLCAARNGLFTVRHSGVRLL